MRRGAQIAAAPATALQGILLADPLRREALLAVAALGLPDCWIGAGFVRDAVWDHLHGYATRPPGGDVDVVLFDPAIMDKGVDRRLERQLRSAIPALDWSVKNQARMHLRNGDGPYGSVAEAMQRWPETATAVAVRFDAAGEIEINAPFGLGDLFTLRLRPTSAFRHVRLPIFDERVASKRWLERYSLLKIEK